MRLSAAPQRIIFAAIVDRFGESQRATAVAIIATLLTQDPLVIALITASQFVPWLIFGLPAGLLLDRYSKSFLAVLAAVSKLVCAAIAVVLVLLDLITPLSLIVVVAAFASLQVLSDTAVNALLPEVSGESELGSLNGKMSAGQSTSSVVAPPVGSTLASWGLVGPFLTSLITSLLVAVSLSGVKSRPSGKNLSKATLSKQLSSGMVELWKRPNLRLLVLTVFSSNFYSGIALTVLPLFALTQLGLSPSLLGLLVAGQAIAMVLGNAYAGRLLGDMNKLVPLMAFALYAKTPALLLIALSGEVWVLLLGMALNGFTAGLWNVPSSSALMIESAGDTRARIISAYKMIATVGAPAGAMVAGSCALFIGIRGALVLAAILALIVAIGFAVKQRSIRNMTEMEVAR